MESTTKFFITFTSPTCSGKSYLLNYIRDVAKLSCFVSTTTRPPRKGEKNGVDYYFISDEKSKEIEANNGFAELATFRGYRYGVTNEEFYGKLDNGMAFLIVEPTGIEHYARPALEANAIWLKYFISVDTEVRVERFKKRFEKDVKMAMSQSVDKFLEKYESFIDGKSAYDGQPVMKVIRNYTDRLIHMLGPELTWKDMQKWDGILDGNVHPEHNLEIILRDVQRYRAE